MGGGAGGVGEEVVLPGFDVVGSSEDGVEQDDGIGAAGGAVGRVEGGVVLRGEGGEEVADGQVEGAGQGEEVVGGELLDPVDGPG